MIDAYRRGYQAGSEEARKQGEYFSEEKIREIALRVFAAMKGADYAHIDPEQDFICGFVEGFRLFFLEVGD